MEDTGENVDSLPITPSPSCSVTTGGLELGIIEHQLLQFILLPTQATEKTISWCLLHTWQVTCEVLIIVGQCVPPSHHRREFDEVTDLVTAISSILDEMLKQHKGWVINLIILLNSLDNTPGPMAIIE